MLGIPLGLLYANAGEWVIHKYVLHGWGKKKNSFFSFHWSEHHRASRKLGFRDPDYERSVFGNHAQGKEALALVGLVALHLPLFPVAPFFTSTVCYAAVNYFHKHRKSHLDPEWAKRHLKHHYDHHMGLNQDANWCVTRPWFDWLMGTRIDYAYDEKGRPLREPVVREPVEQAQPAVASVEALEPVEQAQPAVASVEALEPAAKVPEPAVEAPERPSHHPPKRAA